VAAAALENLTYESASIRRSVAEQGAIPLLVDVLSSGCCAAQKSAAGALHNLAINSSLNCDKIAAAGGIEPLVEMLETAPSTELQVGGRDGGPGNSLSDSCLAVPTPDWLWPCGGPTSLTSSS
jgi:hypothetical protein